MTSHSNKIAWMTMTERKSQSKLKTSQEKETRNGKNTQFKKHQTRTHSNSKFKKQSSNHATHQDPSAPSAAPPPLTATTRTSFGSKPSTNEPIKIHQFSQSKILSHHSHSLHTHNTVHVIRLRSSYGRCQNRHQKTRLTVRTAIHQTMLEKTSTWFALS